MSTTLAGPPSTCCWTGFKHSGTPEGRVESLGGLDTYIAEPRLTTSGSHKKVLLFFSDIFGSLHINNKLLQDYFASWGTPRPCRFVYVLVTLMWCNKKSRFYRSRTRLFLWDIHPGRACGL